MSWMAAATGLGALTSLWGASKQNKFARNSFSNRIREAEKFGIHPLAAIGSAGTPMGDGGFGMASSAFDKVGALAAQRRQEEREDELMTTRTMHQLLLQAQDPAEKRALAQDVLGYDYPISINTPNPLGTKHDDIKRVLNKVEDTLNSATTPGKPAGRRVRKGRTFIRE